MMNFWAFNVVELTENSNGDPPVPPYVFDLARTNLAGGGFGLSGMGLLQFIVMQYWSRAL